LIANRNIDYKKDESLPGGLLGIAFILGFVFLINYKNSKGTL
jgi:hypothetical protein